MQASFKRASGETRTGIVNGEEDQASIESDVRLLRVWILKDRYMGSFVRRIFCFCICFISNVPNSYSFFSPNSKKSLLVRKSRVIPTPSDRYTKDLIENGI